MRTIGFAGTFYTLWDVKSERIDVALGAWYEKITCTYYQNLSKNMGEAIVKAGTDNVDESLKGKRKSFEYNKPLILEPKLITEAERLWRIICVNDIPNLVSGIREEAFEQAKKLGYLTECIDEKEGIYYQWNGKLKYDEFWYSSTLPILFKGSI
jgi:hypothetical protein